jgi:hypothetical protein
MDRRVGFEHPKGRHGRRDLSGERVPETCARICCNAGIGAKILAEQNTFKRARKRYGEQFAIHSSNMPAESCRCRETAV